MESTSSSVSPFQRTAKPHTIDTSTGSVPRRRVKLFKGKDSSQKAPTSTQISAPSFSSQDKMDKKGVHSPTNVIRSTVSDDKDTVSSVQTVADEDTSNSFMAVTLPKSKEENSSSRRRLPRSLIPVETLRKKTMLHKKKKNDKIKSIIKQTLEKFFQQGQVEHIITTQKPDPSEDRLVPDTDQINTSSRRDSPTNNRTRSLSFGEENPENYGEHSYYQDAQNSNEDDDSEMSFDSIALHNLDT
ncbi:hypothetical protein H5410_033465 [Solanum commersonii]|uniref:Uncharacterized protein n=1 Tax=Solanum commersonii TaxID=4109 RepID=A0A9J5YQS2_SOLCO|nr:hypothetical protein H5410_033465 [Solanum commersonii]